MTEMFDRPVQFQQDQMLEGLARAEEAHVHKILNAYYLLPMKRKKYLRENSMKSPTGTELKFEF